MATNAPVLPRSAGRVELAADHPGFSDPAYRARRDAISAVGAADRPGDPIPDVEYAPEEDALWTLVSGELAAKHERFAVREYPKRRRASTCPTTGCPSCGWSPRRWTG